VQEALTNALKHAEQPASVEVRLEYRDPDLAVEVTDDGRARTNGNGNGNGNGAAPVPGGGHGVAGMAERAAAFGGTLEAGPQLSGGWQVLATLRDCRGPVRV
jgi:signal transduction histidine kinase